MTNPVFLRELRSTVRQPRLLWLLCGVAALFTLLIVVRWPTDARLALSGARSQEVFRLFVYSLLAVLLLAFPGFPATSIVREKNGQTLALLFNAPLGSLRILLGKLLAVLSIGGLLLSASLPAAAACQVMGGVSLMQDLLGAYGLLLATALTVASLGFLVSTYAERSDAAIRWTYGLIVVWAVVFLVPYHFFVGAEGWLGPAVEWLRSASPVAAMMAHLGAQDVGTQGITSTVDHAGRFVFVSLALSAVLLLWTLSRLNHAIFDKARDAGLIADEQQTPIRLLRRLLFIVDPRRRSRLIGPLTNPVMVKEFRSRRFGRLHWLLRLIAACAVLSLALAILTTTRTLDWDVPTIGGIMVLLQVALLLLITPSLTAGLISAERESGGWVLLQMTPLPVWRIIWGKLLSVVLTLLLVLCATLPGYCVMIYIEPGLRLEVERVVYCLLITAGFAMLASAAAGSLFRRTAAASAAAYSVLILICAGPLLVWLGRDAPFGHRTVETVLTINPVAAALSVIRVQGFKEYELIPGNWYCMAVGSAIAAAILLGQTYRVSRPN